jgi:hypothetical protein
MEDPEARLEQAYIDEFLQSRGYDRPALARLPEKERDRLLTEASTYAATKLTAIEARAAFVNELHGHE